MLTAIKERATGWIAWAIVILITIPFALWGINSYFEGGTEAPAATVNGRDLPLHVYQDNLQSRTQLLRQEFGDSFDRDMLDTFQVRQQVIDSMIDETVMEQYAEESGFRISDEQLNRIIHATEIFQRDGKFNTEQYRSILAASRYTPQLYEAVERATQATNQIRTGIAGSAFVLPTELDWLLATREQKREIQYALLKTGAFAEDIEVTDDEIRGYYDSNAVDFMSEARIRVSYVELDVETLSRDIAPDDREIADFYEDTKGKYQTPESRRVRHILVGVDESASDEERQSKLNLAREILDRVHSGEDFGELAKEYSDDPGSRNSGGDLGIVARGQMVKPFEDAVFSMNEGDVEGPVETQYGYHIISHSELVEKQQQTLEEARGDVISELQAVIAEQRFAELAEPFMNLVFEHPEDIGVLAAELDLPVRDSDWFTENAGEGIANEAKIRSTAFAEDVFVENLVSQPVEIGFDRIVAIQKLDYEPAARQSLDDVKDRIESILRDERARQKALSLGNEYLFMLQEMEPSSDQWDAFVKEKGLEIQNLTLEKRYEIPFDMMELGTAVYASPRPMEAEITIGGAILSGGDYALYKLLSVQNGKHDEIDALVRDAFAERLNRSEAAGMLFGFSRWLRDQAEVVVYEDRL
ncbi:MAG: hypothetical protein F4244_09005 [Gammaproteobacteria bacterium]|nr:hypothetical protein [Gammaproteobacteria bacterium]